MPFLLWYVLPLHAGMVRLALLPGPFPLTDPRVAVKCGSPSGHPILLLEMVPWCVYRIVAESGLLGWWGEGTDVALWPRTLSLSLSARFMISLSGLRTYSHVIHEPSHPAAGRRRRKEHKGIQRNATEDQTLRYWRGCLDNYSTLTIIGRYRIVQKVPPHQSLQQKLTRYRNWYHVV